MLIAEPAEIDFGRIGSLAPVHATVTLVNPGREPITIDRVHGSCGCTTPELIEAVLPPRGRIQMTLTFDPAASAKPMGNRSELVHVDWDRMRRRTSIPLNATVEDSLRIEPPVLEFEAGLGSPLIERSIRIISVDGRSFEVTAVDPPKHLSSHISHFDPLTSSASIRFMPISDIPLGRIEGIVRIHTTDPAQPLVHLRSITSVRHTLVSDPLSIVLVRPEDNEETIEFNFRLRRIDDAPFTISSVSCSSIPMTFDFIGLRSVASLVQARVSTKASHRLGNLRGDISIIGDPEMGETLSIPFIIAPQ
jgi:hypothetical protein